tara:strand:+ start:6273 stop:7463 length:1191 start_codon:yes stop_codon:yes gene_type:complete
MKKTLFIHIGRPKAGSSAIQHFLWMNKALLMEQGCYYPEAGQRHRASHGLSSTLLPKFSGENKFANLSAKSLYRQLIEEIDEQETADRVVISTENFYFVDPRKVKQFLKEKFNVKIICYVRNQADVLMSSYVQELKEDKLQDDNIANYIQDSTRLRLIDYHANLERWARVFGRENIIVRPYEQGQFEGSDIFRDISHVIGVHVSDEFAIPSLKVNPSPASDVLELIKLLNVMSDSRFVVTQLIRPLLDASEYLPKEDRYDSKRLLTTAQHESINRQFSESNEKVAREFLGRDDGMLFYETCKPEDAVEITKEFTLERFVAVAAKLFLSQQEDIATMRTRLDVQRDKIEALSDLLAQHSGVATEALENIESRSVKDADEPTEEVASGFGSRFRRWFS